MPPRYAYWTILIDNAPTAFRARDREELQPTLTQLRRTNKNVELRWFSRGRLWDSPEQAQWAAKNAVREKRGSEWRPGGAHQDPRARFDKRGPKSSNVNRAATDRPAAGARRPDTGGHRPPGPTGKRPWTGGEKRPAAGSRPWSSSGGTRPPFGNRPPAGANRPGGNRPGGHRVGGGNRTAAGRAGGERPGSRSGDRPGGKSAERPWQRPAPRGAERPPKSATPKRPGTHGPEAVPPHKRDQSPDQPPAPEQMVTKPKPPERG